MDAILQHLVEAAAVLSLPAATHIDRSRAESVFQQLKTVDAPCDVYRHVLTNVQDDMVIFHVATVFKAMVVGQLNGMGGSDASAVLKPCLLQYIIARPDMMRACREQMLATLAVMIKRGWIQDASGSNQLLSSDIDALIRSDVTHRNHAVALSYLTAILHEFATGAQSSATGTTMEVHLLAKQSFEKSQLQRFATAPFHNHSCALPYHMFCVSYTPVMRMDCGSLSVGSSCTGRQPFALWSRSTNRVTNANSYMQYPQRRRLLVTHYHPRYWYISVMPRW